MYKTHTIGQIFRVRLPFFLKRKEGETSPLKVGIFNRYLQMPLNYSSWPMPVAATVLAAAPGSTFYNMTSLTVLESVLPLRTTPGASKYNLIEHRLFSEASKHWTGVLLESFDITLHYLKTTATVSGLSMTATRVDKAYEKGIKISDEQMAALNFEQNDSIPQWNYSIKPQTFNDTKFTDVG